MTSAATIDYARAELDLLSLFGAPTWKRVHGTRFYKVTRPSNVPGVPSFVSAAIVDDFGNLIEIELAT